MINRFYLPNPRITGWGSLFGNFAGERRRVHEIENAAQAQADAQTNAAIAGGVGQIAGATIGTIGANIIGPQEGWGPAEQFAFATSFVPRLEGPSRTALGLGADRRNFEQRQQLQNQAFQNAQALDLARTENDLYADTVEQFNATATGASTGRSPSAGGFGPALDPQQTSQVQQIQAALSGPGSQAQQIAAAMQAPSQAPPGGVPMPIVDPTTIPIYRQAEQDAREIINEAQAIQQDATIPVPEKRRRLQALTPRLAQAQRILAPTRQPPPPTDLAGVQQSGGGWIDPETGTIVERDRYGVFNLKPGSKGHHYNRFVAATAQQLQAQGAPLPVAMEKANEAWVRGKLGSANYDRLIASGGYAYADNEGDVKIESPKDAESISYQDALKMADSQLRSENPLGYGGGFYQIQERARQIMASEGPIAAAVRAGAPTGSPIKQPDMVQQYLGRAMGSVELIRQNSPGAGAAADDLLRDLYERYPDPSPIPPSPHAETFRQLMYQLRDAAQQGQLQVNP